MIMEHNSSLVNLSIPENVTKPIVAAKIQEAVLAAMGGAERIVEAVVHQICNKMVSPETGGEPRYSSDPKVTWMDYHVTSIIQKGIQEELKKQTIELASPVRDALVKELQTKKGATKIANAILSSINGESDFTIRFKVEPTKKMKDNDW